MPGRLLFPYPFNRVPTAQQLTKLDEAPYNNYLQLKQSGRIDGPFMYLGGRNHYSLKSVKSTDRLYICSHIHSQTSQFLLGEGASKALYDGVAMAQAIKDNGLTKAITDIEIFGCSGGATFGDSQYVLRLRQVQKQFSALQKRKAVIEKENAAYNRKSKFARLFVESNELRNNRLALIETQLENLTDEFQQLNNLLVFTDYHTKSAQEQLRLHAPLALELKNGLAALGYPNIRVRGYLGLTQIFMGVIKVDWEENGQTILHTSDDEDHAMGSSTVRRPFAQCFHVY